MFFKKTPQVKFQYNGIAYNIVGFSREDDILKRIRKTKNFYEIEILEFIRSEALEGVYVDVGANIGNHTIYFANECKSTRVISYECYEKVFEILKDNCARNIPSKAIELKNMAVSTSDKAFVHPSTAKNIGQTKTSCDETNRGIGVKSTKLDSLLDELEALAFIKIDVEGNELDVLKSGNSILKKCSPSVLVESMWDNFINVNDFMLALDYRLDKRFQTDPNLYYYKINHP